jgi:2,3-bisphosphoglycerate-independent phosphoglycerate mutase
MNSANPKLKRFIPKQVDFDKADHKVLVVVLDGVGAQDFDHSVSKALLNRVGVLPETAFLKGNAVGAAYMPNLASLMASAFSRTLLAHGPAVGLPSEDDMGNSEVGHNAIGAGRIFAQGAKLVNEAIASGAIFQSEGWKTTVDRNELKKETNTLHLCGLLSDGNVHSHIEHLFAVIKGAKKTGVKRVRLHPLLDGRDVSPTSALHYVDLLEDFLKTQNDQNFDARVASGGGRTVVTMDRYDSDWPIVERGYKAHVLGEGRQFSSLKNAVETLRHEGNKSDQMLPEFVIAENGMPLGTVQDNDSFVFLNFRGDRAIQFSKALTYSKFPAFDRKRFPKVHYAGMMQYDGDLKLPESFLVTPPFIDNTMGQLLSEAGVSQFACSETQKFGHVTYFWNGNKSGKFNETLENYVEIPSDVVSFEQRPWMKCQEICDTTIAAMKANSFKVGRINFANGDMVGHTGDFAATVVSLSALDLSLGRLMQAAKETNTILLVTADHGNADEMFEIDKKSRLVSFEENGIPKAKTSHTLSPVPLVIFNIEAFVEKNEVSLRKDLPKAGLANIAATVLELAGFEPPETFEHSLLNWEQSHLLHESGDTTETKISQQKSQFSTSQSSMPISEIQKKSLQNISTSEANFEVAQGAVEFYRVTKMLRDPKLGCPWDLEQNLASLQPFLIEESYEAIEACNTLLKNDSPENRIAYADELGDVLLQVYLNSEVASQSNQFALSTVFNSITKKMIERHPHVFMNHKSDIENADQVVSQWDLIKNKDKPNVISLMEKAAKKRSLPTLDYLVGISKRSYKMGFAWKSLKETFGDLVSEVDELRHEVEASNPDLTKIADEAGDVIYALANVIVYLNEQTKESDEVLNLDILARQSARKFLNRFEEMEKIQFENGHHLTEQSAKELTLDQWNQLWVSAKKRRYS